MRKDQMVVGAVHAVQFPAGEAHVGRYNGPAPAKATVLEVGVERRGRFGGGVKNDGVRCRLEAPIRVLGGLLPRDRDAFTAHEPGFEFVVASRDVQWLWLHGVDDDGVQAKREARYAMQDELRVIFDRLGGPNVELDGMGVVLSAGELLSWLKRIDPREIAQNTVIAFVEELERRSVGLDAEVFADASIATVLEIEQGIAVSDAEITVEEAGG